MSRLDSFIRRITAQRECLNEAARGIEGVDGVVFELGLGNGRTYHHLRERLPDREIFVFERSPAAHPDCMPDAEHLFVGDVHDTLPVVVERFRGQVALLHCDLGTGDIASNRRLADFISATIPPLMAPGALVLTDPAFDLPQAERQALPDGVEPDRYYVYRWPGRTAETARAAG